MSATYNESKNVAEELTGTMTEGEARESVQLRINAVRCVDTAPSVMFVFKEGRPGCSP